MSSPCFIALVWTLAASPSPSLGEDPTSGATVITAEDIARDKPVSLMALLSEKVGVDEQGGQVSMRGVKGVAVVVDGVPQSTIPSFLNPEDIERIEIVRGAASSRYGASAMGGAVIIRTRSGRAWQLDGIAAFGSFGRHREKMIATGRSAGWSFRVSAGHSVVKKAYEIRAGDAPFAYLEYVQDDSSAATSLEAGLAFRGGKLEADLKATYERGLSVLGRPNWRLDTENFVMSWRAKLAPVAGFEVTSVLPSVGRFLRCRCRIRDPAAPSPGRRSKTCTSIPIRSSFAPCRRGSAAPRRPGTSRRRRSLAFCPPSPGRRSVIRLGTFFESLNSWRSTTTARATGLSGKRSTTRSGNPCLRTTQGLTTPLTRGGVSNGSREPSRTCRLGAAGCSSCAG